MALQVQQANGVGNLQCTIRYCRCLRGSPSFLLLCPHPALQRSVSAANQAKLREACKTPEKGKQATRPCCIATTPVLLHHATDPGVTLWAAHHWPQHCWTISWLPKVPTDPGETVNDVPGLEIQRGLGNTDQYRKGLALSSCPRFQTLEKRCTFLSDSREPSRTLEQPQLPWRGTPVPSLCCYAHQGCREFNS